MHKRCKTLQFLTSNTERVVTTPRLVVLHWMTLPLLYKTALHVIWRPQPPLVVIQLHLFSLQYNFCNTCLVRLLLKTVGKYFNTIIGFATLFQVKPLQMQVTKLQLVIITFCNPNGIVGTIRLLSWICHAVQHIV